MSSINGSQSPQVLVWTPELVAKFWDGMALAGLDDQRSFGRLARRCIYFLIHRHLVPGGRHLDYGAGGGEVAEQLITAGYPFAVLEPSKERQKKTEARLGKIHGFLGAPPSPPVGSFDAVTCFEVLEHVLDADWERVCDELVGHVRPGGKLIVSVPNRENLSLDTVYCPWSDRTFHRWQHVRSIDPEVLVETFRKRGVAKLCLHQLDFFEPLFEPFLSRVVAGELLEPSEAQTFPLHIHQILLDQDGKMGGATRILYIGRRAGN